MRANLDLDNIDIEDDQLCALLSCTLGLPDLVQISQCCDWDDTDQLGYVCGETIPEPITGAHLIFPTEDLIPQIINRETGITIHRFMEIIEENVLKSTGMSSPTAIAS